MHQQYHIAKAWHFVARTLMAAARLTPRRLRVIATLVLALAIGSAGQITPAQAAPADVPIKLYMEIVSPKKTVCVGETVHYEARVLISPFTSPKGTKVGAVPLPGIKVEAFSQNKSVGDFTNTKKGFSASTTSGISLDPSDYELAPLTGHFPFKAKKAGKTTLYFEGLAFGDYVSDKVEVKVINCKYKVKTVSNFSAQGVNLAAIMDGEMKADEQGNFTGSATVNWIGGAISFGDCGGAYYDVASSQADLTGKQDDSGQLAAEVTYLGAVITMSGCASASGTMIPDPLTLSVPSSGGVSTQSQNTYEPNYFSFYGSVVIVVIPVEEAAAFNPGNHEANWGDFSSLLNALVTNPALHGAFTLRRRLYETFIIQTLDSRIIDPHPPMDFISMCLVDQQHSG